MRDTQDTAAARLHREFVEAAGYEARFRARHGELTEREKHLVGRLLIRAEGVLTDLGTRRDSVELRAYDAEVMAERWAELISCAPPAGGALRVELGDRAWRELMPV